MTHLFKDTVELDSGLLIPASAIAGMGLLADASGNATWSATVGADALQPGVVGGGGGTVSATINASTGAITWSGFADTAALWTAGSTYGVLTRGTITGASTTPPLPAYSKWKYVALCAAQPVTPGGNAIFVWSSSADQASALAASATAIAQNQTVGGYANCLVLWDGIIQNTAASGANNYVLVTGGTGAALIPTQGRDRRQWARGAHWDRTETGGSYTFTGFLGIHAFGTGETGNATVPQVRLECSGVPMRIRLGGVQNLSIIGGYWNSFDMIIDGTALSRQRQYYQHTAGYMLGLDHEWIYTPAAGSHLFAFAWGNGPNNGGQTSTAYATTTYPLVFSIDEIIRSNLGNGAV